MNPATRALILSSKRANAFSSIKTLLRANTADVNILIIGDSTGNDTFEWPYVLGQWLAAKYPSYSVSYRLWNDATTLYAAEVVLGTGTGANTIRIWNCSVAGSKPSYAMGANYTPAIVTPFTVPPDVIIWNHGHNLTARTDEVLRGEFLGPMEQVRLTYPRAPVAMFIQNPRRDDDLYTQIAISIRQIASDHGDITLLDANTPYISAGKPSIWYGDSVHPNTLGQQSSFIPAIEASFEQAKVSTYQSMATWLAAAESNRVLNGGFTSFTGAVPTSWSISGNGTCTKDTTVKAPGSDYSVKLVNGTTHTILFQNIDATAYRGQQITLATLMYVETATNINSGQMRLFCNGTGVVLQASEPGNSGLLGWKWVIVSGVTVPSDATVIGPYLYAHDQDVAGATVYIDRTILMPGTIPRNFQHDSVLDGASNGVVWLHDTASPYCYPSQAAPTNGVAVVNMDASTNNGTVVVQSGDAPTFSGGGIDFTGTAKLGNYVNGAAAAAASIWGSANQYFIVCVYMKLPTKANWNTSATLFDMFKFAATNYVAGPELLLIAQQFNNSQLTFRRQTAAGTVDTLAVIPAAGDYGTVVQVAFWRDATGQYARIKSANGTVLASGAVSTNNTQDFSALTPELGVPGGLAGVAGGAMIAAHANAAKFRLYGAFVENLVVSGRDATTVLNAHYARNAARGAFS